MPVRANAVAGSLTEPMGPMETTMVSEGLMDLPAVTGSDFARVTIYRRNTAGRVTSREVVHVTSHESGAMTAAVQRAREGTSAKDWVAGDRWDHALTVADLNGLRAVDTPVPQADVDGLISTTTNVIAASVVGSDSAIKVGSMLFPVTAEAGWPGSGMVETHKTGSSRVTQTYYALGSRERRVRSWDPVVSAWTGWRRVDDQGHTVDLGNNLRQFADPGSAYPDGTLIFRGTSAGGWPFICTVQAIKTSDNRVHQWILRLNSAESIFRAWDDLEGVWRVLSATLPDDELTAASAASSWPDGVTVMRGGSGGGWPTNSGVAATSRSGNRANQLWHGTTGSWVRQWTGSAWEGWISLQGRLLDDSRTASSPIGDFPLGMTIMRSTTHNGWPGGLNGHVRTHRSAAFVAEQVWERGGKRWTRHWDSDADDWSGWVREGATADIDLRPLDATLTPRGDDPSFRGVLPDGFYAMGIVAGTPRVYRRADWDDPWVEVAEISGASQAGTVVAMPDGRYMALLQQDGLWLSSGSDLSTATWVQVLVPTTADGQTAEIQANGFDTWGDLAVAAEVIRGPVSWAASRHIRLSTDGGQTWSSIRDINAVIDPQAHAHIARFDRHTLTDGTPRIWISYHDNTNKRLEYSDDLGSSWTVFSDQLMPMTCDDLPAGVVFGTDNEPDGIFVVDRETTSFRRLHEILTPHPGIVYVARHSFVDPATGICYIAYRSSRDDAPPVIVATDGVTGAEVWRWTLPTGSGDRIEHIGVRDGLLVARVLPTSDPEYYLTAAAIRWRPGRLFFRRDGADDVLAVGLPSGDAIDLGTP